MPVGDRLASGAPSAQFSTQSGISDFENDLIFRPEIVAEKYGLTEKEIEMFQRDRISGVKLPDLTTTAIREETAEDLKDAAKFGFTVTDRRIGSMPSVVSTTVLKYPPRQYEAFKPILDRVLVKRVSVDTNLELLEDGSMRDKKTGFIIPAKYRQHSNTGVVLAVGDFVVMGGLKTYMRDIVSPGDRVTYGDYNSEIFHMEGSKVEALCDYVGINYEPDEEGLRIVRVQDIRGVERFIEEGE